MDDAYMNEAAELEETAERLQSIREISISDFSLVVDEVACLCTMSILSGMDHRSELGLEHQSGPVLQTLIGSIVWSKLKQFQVFNTILLVVNM